MFITVEGIEGAGKSTLLAGLADYFQERAREVVVTREPGGCALGQRLRALLLDPEAHWCATSELLLFLADRAQHVSEVIRPALERGAVVLCDRYADSTIVYQGYGRGLDIALLLQLNRVAVQDVWPDVTLVLDMDVEAALQRAIQRNAAQGLRAEGRFEAESLAFHSRLRAGFQDWAAQHPERIRLLDAACSPDALLQRAISELDKGAA